MMCKTVALCDIIGYGYFLSCICQRSTYGLCHASPGALAFNLSPKEVSIFTLGLVSRRNWFWYHFPVCLVRVCQSPVGFFFFLFLQVISHEPVRSCGCWIINSKCIWFLILCCGHRVILRAEHDKALTTDGNHISESQTLWWKIDLGLSQEKILFNGTSSLLVSQAIRQSFR